MAPGTYRRPAKDNLTAAKRGVVVANVAMGRHFSTCYQCSHNRADPGKYCDDGWTLVKAATRANAAVRKLNDKAAAAPEQGKLW